MRSQMPLSQLFESGMGGGGSGGGVALDCALGAAERVVVVVSGA